MGDLFIHYLDGSDDLSYVHVCTILIVCVNHVHFSVQQYQPKKPMKKEDREDEEG